MSAFKLVSAVVGSGVVKIPLHPLTKTKWPFSKIQCFSWSYQAVKSQLLETK